MSIMKKIAAFKRKAVSHKVNDVEFNFYPVRIGRLLTGEIKEAIAPLARAITTVLSVGDGLKPERATQIGGEDDPDLPQGAVYTKESEISVAALDWAVASRSNAIEGAFKTALDPKTLLVLGRVLADSLREDFEKNPSDEELLEFMNELDIKDVCEMCVGFMKANAEVFGFDASNREKAGNLARDLLDKMVELARASKAPMLRVVPDEAEAEDE